MNFEMSTLVTGFIVSSVGFVLFKYGRKMERPPHVIVGLVLIVFPYFIAYWIAALGIAALLCVLLYLATRAGY